MIMKNKPMTIGSIILIILCVSSELFVDSKSILHDLITNVSLFGFISLVYFSQKEKIIEAKISNKLRITIKSLLIISLTCLILSIFAHLYFYPDGNRFIYSTIALINCIAFFSFLYIIHYKI